MINNQFYFLLCSERSGSNFITKILDGHPEVCGPSPFHLLRLFSPLESKYGDLSVDENWKNLVQDVLHFFNIKISHWETNFDLDELVDLEDRNLSALFRFMYGKEAKINGKNNLFVKENHAYKLLPYYQYYFPNSKFVWAVRDPRDMALSWKKDPILRGEVVRASNIWKEDQKQTLFLYNLLKKNNSIIKIRYEDLISDTLMESKKLTTFLGLEFFDQMIQMKNSKSSQKNAEASVGWSNLNKGVIRNNSKKYLDGLSKKEIQFIEYLCKEEMKELGYSPEFPLIEKDEFLKIQYDLSLNEKFDKEQYQSVSENEKEKRNIWMKWVKELQEKFA